MLAPRAGDRQSRSALLRREAAPTSRTDHPDLAYYESQAAGVVALLRRAPRRRAVRCAGVSTDECLMKRVQTGDERALGELLDRYRAPLFGFLVRRIGDAVSAEDLFQETWLRVVRARARYDPQRRFSTWLFQIANNLCRDLFRRRGSENRAREVMRAAADIRPRQTASSVLDARLDVAGRLARLPDRLRAVIVLRYFHQMPEREIAEVVGIRPGTVKSRLHSAVKMLRELDAEAHAQGVGKDGS
jgi:RNA polymerase sigma-70 factor (ECF subfamily)